MTNSFIKTIRNEIFFRRLYPLLSLYITNFQENRLSESVISFYTLPARHLVDYFVIWITENLKSKASHSILVPKIPCSINSSPMA